MAIKHSTAVGVFRERERAEDAIRDLQQSGFANGDIGYAIRSETPRTRAAQSPRTGANHGAGAGEDASAAGAATGALTGGLLGGIVGAAAALLIPGIGPVVAGGVLASALGGAAIGAAAGGLLGALVGMGIPEEEARFYEDEFRAGRAVVTVRAPDRYDDAQAILRRHGAYNVGTRSTRAAAMTGAIQAETKHAGAALPLPDERDAARPEGTRDSDARAAGPPVSRSER